MGAKQAGSASELAQTPRPPPTHQVGSLLATTLLNPSPTTSPLVLSTTAAGAGEGAKETARQHSGCVPASAGACRHCEEARGRQHAPAAD